MIGETVARQHGGGGSSGAADGVAAAPRPSSRIGGFYRLELPQRLARLVELGIIEEADAELLGGPQRGLALATADQMIENAVGTLELPLGLGLNFEINGRDYVVPMAIEEPSVVAAVSHVAKIVRGAGGFEASCDRSTMIGQVQVLGVEDLEAARERLLEAEAEIVAEANSFEPRMVERGGGARGIEVRTFDEGRYQKMLVVHLLIDCCDAMGANMINTMAEGVAPLVERLTGGQVFLRILSNLADQRLIRARCRIPVEALAWKKFDGLEVARGIAQASEFAERDPYRATTHNKGVMNGISAVCIATGNDWRALEAGAHAYCARDGQYRPMATWRLTEDEEALVGELEIPMQVGTVGGPIRLHPTVKLVHKILRLERGAQELAEVMGAVGLAQNMAALKALATEGIQKGHMSLHARCVAATAGARPHELEAVVRRLIASEDIKIERARELIAQLRRGT